MQAEDVIDGASWLSGLGAWLIVASQYSVGVVSAMFNMAGLVVNLLILGALLAHFPSSRGTA